MTDQYNALVVVLKQDTPDYDVKGLVDTIKQLQGVCSVKFNVVDINSHVAYTRARTYLLDRLLDIVSDDQTKG